MAGAGSGATTYAGAGISGGYGGKQGERVKTVTLEKSKTVSYGTTNQIYKISADASASASNELMPTAVEVENTGMTPVTIMTGYETYSEETVGSGATKYLHSMLMPGETFSPPIRAVISTESASTQFDGTPVSNTAPDSNEYTATGSGCADLDNTTDPVTFTTVGARHRVGDLIRVENEVMEVTAISGDDVTVKRAMYGSSVDSHSDGVDVRYPFFNAYHDYNKYSVAQTDANGKFKCQNFFGLGRAATGNQGIVPGSVAIKFYEAGYQSLGLSGITSGTNSGLSVSTEYGFDITVDSSGINSDNMKFTTDSSNVNWGGTNGVISKIQAVLNTQYYTTSSPLIGKKVAVGIVGGDIRFTSGQHLSSSAMLLAAPSGGETTPFGVGAIPAIGSVRSPVAARLPDDVSYDRVTYTTSPNNVFCYDDGYGNLLGVCSGTINYETGAIDMTGAPVNAEFVYSVAHTSAFSGKLAEAGTGRINGLIEILANTSNQKQTGSVALRTY